MKESALAELEKLNTELYAKLFRVKHGRGVHHRKKKIERLEQALKAVAFYRTLIEKATNNDWVREYIVLINNIRTYFEKT